MCCALSTGADDFMSISDANITFSGRGGEVPPALRLRLTDDSVPERTEQLRVHLMLPPVLEYGLLLENQTATVVILDNDGEVSLFRLKYLSRLDNESDIST